MLTVSAPAPTVTVIDRLGDPRRRGDAPGRAGDGVLAVARDVPNDDLISRSDEVMASLDSAIAGVEQDGSSITIRGLSPGRPVIAITAYNRPGAGRLCWWTWRCWPPRNRNLPATPEPTPEPTLAPTPEPTRATNPDPTDRRTNCYDRPERCPNPGRSGAASDARANGGAHGPAKQGSGAHAGSGDAGHSQRATD